MEETVPHPCTATTFLSASEFEGLSFEEGFMVESSAQHTRIQHNDFILRLNRDAWIEQLIPRADKSKMSIINIFRYCAATIQEGGGNLNHIQISTKTIRKICTKVKGSRANSIKSKFIFLIHFFVCFDTKGSRMRK